MTDRPDNLYDQLAIYYDLVHASVTADIPFYLALAREAGSPVLELGCGSGRTLVPLAAAGVEVVGLDNSAGMLELARARLAQEAPAGRAELVLGEMADFDLGRQFPLVTVPYNTWMHLGHAQQPAALRCIGRHLAAGGWLVLDLPAPASIVELEHDQTVVLERTLVLPESGEKVLQFSSTELDEDEQVLHITWLYDRVGHDGLVRRLVAPMALHYLFPHGAELLLQAAGLPLKALWGSYARNPYTGTSDRMILVAGRPRPGPAD